MSSVLDLEALNDPIRAATKLGVEDAYQQLSEATQELFPGALKVTVEEDPEIPGDFRIVLQVQAAGSYEQIVQRELEWCRRVCRLNTHGVFRLAIDPQE